MSVKCPKCQHENPDDTLFCGKCGTQFPDLDKIEITETMETPKEELTTGSTFADRYQIIEELGKGGMGRVYKVLDKEVNAKVALKLIKPEIASDKKTIDRFRNELKVARDIAHKNVCRMYDLGKEAGAYYITMEYVSGEDLKSFIRRSGFISTGKAISIANQVCEGLLEAHRLGVVHRDLKPQNIMIDKDGNARIMDFGIARSLRAKGITGSGVMIGTPEYMSPEQVDGKEADQRADIYSLGVILYEMVTGIVPFEGETPFSIGVKQKSETPRPPKEINEQIPEALNRVILKCMEKEKEKRYQSVSELHSELKNLEKGIPQTEMAIPERKPLTSKEITVTFGLKKLITPALIVIAILAVGLIIWSPWTPKIVVPPSLEKPSIAVLPFEDLSPQLDQRHLCDGIAESIIMALSKVDQLRIPASTSSFLFRGKDVDVQEIGEKLNVETLLTGSVQKAGNRLRLWAQLINIEDESILWNEQYDHEVDDIFTIQDEITLKIIDVLKVKLLGEDRTYIVKRYTEDSEAYNLYLKGRHFWNLRTKDGLNRALDYFQMAIETDQSYALAYSGLADCYSMLPWYGDWLPEEAYLKAKTAALNAIKIDGQLSEAYASLAIIKNWFDWDWHGAENEYKRAIELNPSYASAHQWYAFFLSIMGRNKEAIEEAKFAVELDPLSLIIITNLGDRFFEDRQYDKAIEQYYKALEINSDFASSLIWLGKISLIKKKYEDALEKFTETGHPHVVSALMGLGKKEDALNCLNEWTKRSLSENVDQVYLAFAYLGVRDIDRVFEHIENAFSNHYPRLLDFILDPYVIDILQSDPRFTELLKKMKLE